MAISFLYILYLLFIFLACNIWDMDNSIVLKIFNLSFSFYVILKLIEIRKRHFFFINPIVLASLFMFLFSYGFPYLVAIKYQLIDNTVDASYLIKAMLYANVAFIVMWHSYFSLQMRKICIGFLRIVTCNGKLLSSSYNLKYNFLYFLFIIYLIVTLIQIKTGTYGYLSAFSDKDLGILSALFNAVSFIGSGVIFLLLLVPDLSRRKRIWLIVFFCLNLFFQILSGLKGNIIRAFLLLFIADYIKRSRLNYKLLCLSFVAIFFSYFIVESYRLVVRATEASPKSISEIVQLNVTGLRLASSVAEQPQEIPSYAFFLSRFSALSELANFVDYKENEHIIPNRDPDFMFRTLTIPFQVFIPQTIWKNKPKENLGSVWINQRVFGRDDNNSLAFGPVGFLYLVGGVASIILGFIFVAFFLKMAEILLFSNKIGGIIISFVLIALGYGMEASFNAYVVNLVRFLFIALLFQYIILNSATL